jgi:acetolactate synthase-1/2/3 large subunit
MTSGSELLRRALGDLGVQHVFGVPGTQNVGFFEVLRQARIRTVVATNELAAGFMANGYARTSGRVGIVSAIPGPGFTWAMTAIAEARHDSVPLVLITGAPEGARPFSLQVLDQEAMIGPVVKGVFRATVPGELATILHRAHALALEGEPGPVAVELPDRLLGGAVHSPDPVLAQSPGPIQPDTVQWNELLEMLQRSTRPLLMAGQGCASAAAELLSLAERLGAPVATSISGRGVIPETHALALAAEPSGPGIEALNAMARRADLILVLGWKLSHNGSGGFQLKLPPERMVHVDRAPGVLNANYPARLAMRADVPTLLGRLAGLQLGPSAWTAAEIEACRAAAAPDPAAVEPVVNGVEPPTAARFFAELRAALPADGILALDSGQHQMLARRHFRVHAPRGFLLPTDFQSMGFGIPAAIGAAVADPGRRVVALVGDGGFAMSGLELATAVREKVPLTVVVFVDESLGLIRLQQYREFGYEFGTRLERLDLAAFAQAVGASYLPLRGNAGMVLRDAIRPEGVAIVEVALGDSAALLKLRAAGVAREAVRSIVPERVLARVKRWIR